MRKFAKGGFSAEQEEWLGGADRTDPYILARMRAAHPDKAPTVDDSPAGTSGYGEENEMPSSTPVTKTVSKTKVSVTKPETKPEIKSKSLDFSMDEEGNKLPTNVKKPYVAIPKNAAGMQQYRSDSTSPMGNLLRKITGSKIGLKSGGSVKSSASKRADGCAIRGKTRA